MYHRLSEPARPVASPTVTSSALKLPVELTRSVVMLEFEPAPDTPDHARWQRARTRRRIEIFLAVCAAALVTGMFVTFYSILTNA
jgi:hypothetical protein